MENQRLQAELEFRATQKSHKEFLAGQHKDFRGSSNQAAGTTNNAAATNGAGDVPAHKYARIPPESERRAATPTNRQDAEAQNVKNFLMDNIEKSLLTISMQESAQYVAGASRAITPSGGTLDPSIGSMRAGTAPQPQEPSQTMQDLNNKLHSLSLSSSGGGESKPMSLAERKIAALIEMNLQDIQASNEREAATSAGGSGVDSSSNSRKQSVKSKGGKSKPGSVGGGVGAATTGGIALKMDDGLNMNSLMSDSAGSLATSQSSIQLGTAKFSLPPVHINNSASAKTLRK